MNKRIFFVPILVIVLSAFGYAGGGRDEPQDNGDYHDGLPRIDPVNLDGRRLRVAATTSIIGDVVRNVAGSAAEVTVLMAPGQNPHAYSPSPREIAVLEKADVIFVNGLDLEEELMPVLEAMEGLIVVPVSAGIEPVEGAVDDHDEGEQDDSHADEDPHFWFSPLNVIQWTENIEHALSAADPGERVMYEESAQAYLVELAELDREVREAVSTIPGSDRKLVMDHFVAGYYARDYGFEILGSIVPSISDQAEPSARELAELTDVVKKEGLKAIFVGETSGRGMMRLAESIVVEVGREVAVVELLTGSLTEPGNRGDTYLDFVRYNTERIVGALSGQSP